jgi:uncharacterized protein YneF (UPF0154 family)
MRRNPTLKRNNTMKKFIEFIGTMLAITVTVAVGTALGIFIAVNTGFEVKTYEKNPINNVAVQLHAMTDGKTHHMFENKDIILDISYNK